jgi:hypothetical protein
MTTFYHIYIYLQNWLTQSVERRRFKICFTTLGLEANYIFIVGETGRGAAEIWAGCRRLEHHFRSISQPNIKSIHPVSLYTLQRLAFHCI